MKIGIICAGDREFAPFVPVIKEYKITEKAMLKFYKGRISNVDVVALFSGVCKVNAAIATQLLIDIFQVDAIINAGTAGGMDERLNLFDVTVSTEVAYHDVAPHILTEFHPWMDSIFFQAMETASIAHVCYVNNIPFISIRCITDTADHSGTGSFEENCEKASLIAKDITIAVLEEINEQSI